MYQLRRDPNGKNSACCLRYLTMGLSDAGLRQRQTKAVYPDHQPTPCLTEDAVPRSLEPIVRRPEVRDEGPEFLNTATSDRQTRQSQLGMAQHFEYILKPVSAFLNVLSLKNVGTGDGSSISQNEGAGFRVTLGERPPVYGWRCVDGVVRVNTHQTPNELSDPAHETRGLQPRRSSRFAAAHG